MKKIRSMLVAVLAAVAIGLLAIPQTVNAQASYNSSYTLSPSGPVAVLGNTASNVAWVVDARLQSKITLQIDVGVNTNQNIVVAFPIYRSVDAVTYSVADQLITLPTLAAYTSTFVTNIDTLGCGWIKIPWLTNSSTSGTITNVVVKPALKRNAP